MELQLSCNINFEGIRLEGKLYYNLAAKRGSQTYCNKNGQMHLKWNPAVIGFMRSRLFQLVHFVFCAVLIQKR